MYLEIIRSEGFLPGEAKTKPLPRCWQDYERTLVLPHMGQGTWALVPKHALLAWRLALFCLNASLLLEMPELCCHTLHPEKKAKPPSLH